MIEAAYAFCLVVGLVILSDEQRRAAAERVREALRLANIALSEAAFLMGIEASDLTRGLSGERKLDYWRLEMLPESFQQNFHYLGALAHGLPEHVCKAVKMGLPAAVDLKKEA